MSLDTDGGSTAARESLLPGPRELLVALRAITVVPPRAPLRCLDTAAVYYPLVGLLLGGLWAATDWTVRHAGGHLLASAAVLLVAALATSARPVRGLGCLMAAATRTRDRAGALKRLDGRAPWEYAVLIGALELWCLVELDRFRTVGLLFAPLLGCWSMVVLAVGVRAARADGRQLKFAPRIQFRHFAVASVGTFGVLFWVTDFLGILLAVPAAALAVGLRLWLHRWLGGISDAALAATWEITQLATLALLAAF